MLIYIVAFTFSSSLLYCAEKIREKKIRILITIIAILIPTVLAGCRANTIGTDVETYAIPYFNQAKNSSSFLSFLNNNTTSLLSEPLYYFITFAIARIFYDYHWALFFYSLLTIGFIYLGLKRCNRIFKTPIWLGMLLYYLVLYNYTLNIIRQCIAVSIVFYGVTFLFEKQYKKYFLFMIIALGFHTSSIIAFAFLPMFLILNQGTEQKLKKQLIQGSIFLIVLVGIVLLGSNLVQFLVKMGIIRSWYMEYLSGGKFATNGNEMISLTSLLPQITYLVILIFHYKFTMERKQESLFFLMNAVIVFLVPYTYLIAHFASRLGYYFMPVLIVSLANIPLCYSKKSRGIINVGLILFMFLIWYREIVLLGYNDTVPYIFFWN